MTLRFPTSSVVSAPEWGADASRPWKIVDFPVRYGLFEHPREGVVLIDTGYTRELLSARGADMALYRALLRPRLDDASEPGTLLARIGATAADVRHVVITHLHADHVSGLARLRRATIHASRATLRWWNAPPLLGDARHGMFRQFLPRLPDCTCQAFEDAAETPLPWGGTGRDILGDGTILAVDLPGHMTGHAGVAFVQREAPVLYAVDSAWTAAGYRRAVVPPYPLRAILDSLPAYKASNAQVLAAETWGARVVLCHDPDPLEDIA